MVKTDHVIKFLKTQDKPVSFDVIWKNVKAESMASITKELPEVTMMSDLHLSLMEEEKVIMVEDNKWFLKEKYSLKDLSEIEKDRLTTEETLLNMEESEESEETKEMLFKFKK